MAHSISTRWVRFGSLSLLLLGTSSLGWANEPSDLKSVLEKETAGQSVNRVGEFDAWQLGFVRDQKGWKSFESVDSPPKEKEYLAKREALKDDPQMHLKLAHWCVRNQLHERARAHYFGVLKAEPNHTEAREFLGHIFLGNNWVDQHEFAKSQVDMRDSLEGMEKCTQVEQFQTHEQSPHQA
jgi:hypothetical protein